MDDDVNVLRGLGQTLPQSDDRQAHQQALLMRQVQGQFPLRIDWVVGKLPPRYLELRKYHVKSFDRSVYAPYVLSVFLNSYIIFFYKSEVIIGLVLAL